MGCKGTAPFRKKLERRLSHRIHTVCVMLVMCRALLPDLPGQAAEGTARSIKAVHGPSIHAHGVGVEVHGVLQFPHIGLVGCVGWSGTD